MDTAYDEQNLRVLLTELYPSPPPLTLRARLPEERLLVELDRPAPAQLQGPLAAILQPEWPELPPHGGVTPSRGRRSAGPPRTSRAASP